MKTLYVCYFGLREPLVQTQVLPYLRQLSRAGIGVGLLTFEPKRRTSWSTNEVESWRERLRFDGIDWHSMTYHKRPSLTATIYDIAAGGLVAARLVRRHGYHVVHGRAHVATAICLVAKRLTGCKLVFDIRGFNPEEYVDAGVWPAGSVNFRLAKYVEMRLLAESDAFVVLTERARNILFPRHLEEDMFGRPVEVIPCCVDLHRFDAAREISREDVRRELGLTGRRVLVYVGAMGGFYLTDRIVELMAVAYRRNPTTFCLILSQSSPKLIEHALQSSGFNRSDYLILHVPAHEVPRYLRAADVGISFIKPTYSKQASSPTKIAEYLASGLPVITNTGIGDVDEVIESDRVGVLVQTFDAEEYTRALGVVEELVKEGGVPDRCRRSAAKRFDLTRIGGERYCRLYRRLARSETSSLWLGTHSS